MENSLEDPQQYLEVLASLHDDLLERELHDISLRIPKRPLVLFFGRATFSDNSKYAYLHALRHLSELEIVWCASTSDLARQLDAKGLPVIDLTADPRASARELLQCAVAVFCENPQSTFAFYPSLAGALAGAQVIQLWHGISVKPLDLMLLPHLDVLNGLTRRSLRMSTRPDYFLSTAAIFDAFWEQAHGARRILRAGQPRNSVIVREASDLERIGAELPSGLERQLADSAAKVILVAPTWYRGEPSFVSDPSFYERLAVWATEHDATIAVKPHPFLRSIELNAQLRDHIVHVDAGIDLYPWLSRFAALITDYSSIMFDFVLTGKPILTFDPHASNAKRFEPDWSLVPATPFRYEFDTQSMERVLTDALRHHPLQRSQQYFAKEIFPTDPLLASDTVCRLIEASCQVVTNHAIDVIELEDT